MNGADQPHIAVQKLSVTARGRDGGTITLVSDIDFTLRRGEVLALIGESGSGKTTIALTLMGYARPGATIAGGSIRVGDTDVRALAPRDLAALRGNRVAYIAQSAAAAFNPSRTLMDQVIEPALIHGLMPRAEAETKAIALFRALALPSPESIGARYPHQLSGGQLQRLMAAMALMTDPELVILDEPTTALDVTTQIDVLRAFKSVIRQQGASAIYVSHDLAVVAQMADQILVLNKGRICEQGTAGQVLHQPADSYTRTLMAAARPELRPAPPAPATAPAPLLEVRGLSAGYGGSGGKAGKGAPVLRDINLTIAPGAALGIIGESGCGKSTLARVIAGLLPPATGDVLLDGKPLPAGMAARSKDQLRDVQLVFQNADTALNPAHDVFTVLARPLAFYHGLTGAAARRRVAELIDLIRLPAGVIDQSCTALSGGQKQRINLARALAAQPRLILCDEVTSALDTVVGAAIIDLLAELRRDLGLAYLFISHDISTVRALCDDIVVLYAGQMVEAGPRAGFATAPFHPYSDLLTGSVPQMRAGWLEECASGPVLPAIGPAADDPALCRFLPRCAQRRDGLCNRLPPPHQTLAKGSRILCHLGDAELAPAPAQAEGACA